MSTGPVLVARGERGVARLTLDRPERHNAFDDEILAALDAALGELAADRSVRVVVLAATGKSFCAGADLGWMRRHAEASEAENLRDAEALAATLRRLAQMPQPTLARVQGAAYGGGVGLVAACDLAVAAEDAHFRLSEVRLGLIPAVIAPLVCAAIGPRAARRYMLTAERFDATAALALGLVHELAPAGGLEGALERLVGELLEGGPEALAAAKRLVAAVAGRPLDAALGGETARLIAERRASPEGREGMSAFLDKRPPAWSARARRK